MADPEASGPRLVNVTDDAAEAPEPASPESQAPAKRGPVFWLLVGLVVLAVAGFAFQTERVRALQSNNVALEGQLFSTRTALGAYTDRFAVVRDTVAGLQAQLDALGALVSEDPVSSEPDRSQPSGAPAGGN